MNQELFHYINDGMYTISGVLAIVLASMVLKLTGKGWLVASVVIDLVTGTGYRIVNIVLNHTAFSRHDDIYQWYNVLGLGGIFATACFAFFLFSNYVMFRTNLNTKTLFFHFSGRIPRSAFWIAVCILFPLGILAEIAPLQHTHGFMAQLNPPCVIFWILYVCFAILHIWISLALYAKRWHDCDKSGWMTFIIFVPIVGIFWFYGYLGFVRGTDGPNQYGEDPLIIQPERPGHSGIA